ncbi:fibroblast growth factor 9-like [Ornithodoros turicata]|uniref:fibroblast growth factor 9-like n=1 Tax=Ornithodoros turicata TaxID=34597 RepID=UPI003138B14D
MQPGWRTLALVFLALLLAVRAQEQPDEEDEDSSETRRIRHAVRSQDLSSEEEDLDDDSMDAVKHPRGTSRYMQLFFRTGYNLVIQANGKVNGTREDRNRYAVLEMNAVAVKLYSIRGVVSARYLCMNRRGQLSGQKRRSEKCIFQLQELPSGYSTLSSMRYSRGTRWRWYLSIGKNGHVKRGRRPRQKGTNFLPRSVKDFRP